MAKYVRKTNDEFHTQGLYFGVWETVTIDETMAEARQMLKDYNENECGIPHRIIKRRVKKEEK